MAKPKHAISLAVDQCLFNDNYLASPSTETLLETNKALLSELKNAEISYDETICLLGCTRQSFKADGKKNKETGSAFVALEAIALDLNATLDPFLLADIYGELPAGQSLEWINQKETGRIQADWVEDPSKLSIIYAQIHKLACEHPDEMIIYDFYEGDEQTAQHLFDFFQKNTDLIPNNIRLHLNHYTSKNIAHFSTILGNGFIDSNYRQTTQDIAKIIQNASPQDKFTFTSSQLTHRIPGVDEHFLFLEQLRILHDARVTGEKDASMDSIEVIQALEETLLHHWNKFLNREESAAEFKLASAKVLHHALQAAPSHSVWQHLLNRLITAVATLGVIYVSPGAYSKGTSSPFSFFGKKPASRPLEEPASVASESPHKSKN